MSSVDLNDVAARLRAEVAAMNRDVDDLYEQPFKRMGDPDVVFRQSSDVDVIVDVLKH